MLSHRILLTAIVLVPGRLSWGLEHGVEALLVPRSTKTIDIPFYTIYDDGLFMYTNATVGTPGQLVVMPILTYWGDSQLSNGSDIWVSNKTSSTFKILPNTEFSTSEGTDNLYSGEYAQDTISFNGNDLEEFVFAYIEYGVEVQDDFIGLGDKVDEAAVQDEESQTQNTLLTYATSKGLIQTPAFSIAFDNPLDTLPTGDVLLGGLDAGKINGSLETLDTTIMRGTNTFYDTVLAVSLGGISFSPNGDLSHQTYLQLSQSVLIHPTTGPMGLPPNVATSLWDSLSASYDTFAKPEEAVPVVPCSYLSNTTTLNLQFGSNTIIQVPMADLTVHNGTGLNGDSGTYAEGCKLDIIAVATDTSFNRIGAAALKYMYTVFDLQNNQISIGLRNKAAGGTYAPKIMEIGQLGVPALNLNGSAAPSPMPTPTPTPNPSPTPSPTPQPKSSHALAIGLGVGIPLGVILVIGVVAGLFYLLRRNKKTSSAPNASGMAYEAQAPYSAGNTQHNSYPPSNFPEKLQANASTQPIYAVSPPTSPPSQTIQQFPGTSPGELGNHGENRDAPTRYSELSGIDAAHPPYNPSHSTPNSPPLGR
ncbi:putative aspartic-type endopeptidase OPSB [Lachnellula suecica]|uniref:Putative aspartic-type endopeptidase OPSB n=1 Tax=Lachnellula suecica TaxID=602035 RepID=A0A8T9C2G0_9HELO|nr:putative aspartic-type endopeptidase OPSB [Lachnellula suecica]